MFLPARSHRLLLLPYLQLLTAFNTFVIEASLEPPFGYRKHQRDFDALDTGIQLRP